MKNSQKATLLSIKRRIPLHISARMSFAAGDFALVSKELAMQEQVTKFVMPLSKTNFPISDSMSSPLHSAVAALFLLESFFVD